MNFTYKKVFYFHKLLCLCKLTLSYFAYKITSSKSFGLYPVSVSIEPVNCCNLRCPECPAGNQSLMRKREMMEWSLFTKTVDELSKSLFWVTLYFQGEPYLHPEFLAMVSYCHMKGLFTYTSSNAQLITSEVAKKTVESGLDKIVISVDGLTQEVYEKYRQGGSLQKVIEAIQYLAYWKRELKSATPVIEAQFIVMKHNEFQVGGVKNTVLSWGAGRVAFKSAQIDFERIEKLVPSQTKFSRYVQAENGGWRLKKKPNNRCWRQWVSAVVAVNGDVLPCCFDKNGEHVFGNIAEKSFFEIWNGEKANHFRKMVNTNRNDISICQNCSE